MLPLLRLGNLGIRIQVNSPRAREQVKRFLASLSEFQPSQTGEKEWTLNILDFNTSRKNSLIKSPILWLVEPGNESVLRYEHPYTNQDYQRQFLYFAANDPRALEPMRLLFCVMFMATLWHTLDGSLCLHAAAVSRDNLGYLFLGKSGAGKSTLASLSSVVGNPVLGDDRVFLLKNQKNEYSLASAPEFPPQLITHPYLRPPLRGVFTLIKDSVDGIIPLSQPATARALLDSFFQNSTSGWISSDAIRLAFRAACDISRNVPGFELHFRKSPDFWKLIDEQFPD